MNLNDSNVVLTHTECENMLPAYINGQLSHEIALAMAVHVASCTLCLKDMQLAYHIRDGLAAEPDAMATGLQPSRQEANFNRLWSRIEPSKSSRRP